MQQLQEHKPIALNMDMDETQIPVSESPYLKNYRLTFNKNGRLSAYSGGETGSGSNMGVGTPIASNVKLTDMPMPDGRNKCIGMYESLEANELYYFNWNSNNNHGVYRVNGFDNSAEIVFLGPELSFSPDPKYSIPDHRVHLTIIYDSDDESNRKVKFKILQWVDGLNPQRWMDVEASIATGSFNEQNFPYYKVFAPHYDRSEFIDMSARPPMSCPVLSASATQPDDSAKVNHLLNKSVQFAYRYIFTDGRTSKLSPTSVNYFIDSGGCFVDISSLPRCVDMKIYAGSALVEKIQILFKSCSGDWYLYDTIEKYKTCDGLNGPETEDKYWLRRNMWTDYDFDSISNSITYTYCGNKECSIFSQDEANAIQNDIPIRSFAMTPAGDSMLLGNNLYGRDNFSCGVTDSIKLETKLKSEASGGDDPNAGCQVKNVRIRVYAIISNTSNQERWMPQFVWKWTQQNETFCRFGGQGWVLSTAQLIDCVSTDGDFKLPDGQEGFLGYLAGTPYAAISKQYLADSNYNLTLTGPKNINSNTDKVVPLQTVPHYVQVFEFLVPAGKYIFRIADHHAKPADTNYQRTSTFTKGLYRATQGVGGIFENQRISYEKELVIDACNGDFDMWSNGNAKSFFLIYTPDSCGRSTDSSTRYRFVTGYLMEDDVSKVPVEGIEYVPNHGSGPTHSSGCKTDHNGFFFQFAQKGGAWETNVQFRLTTRCGNQVANRASTGLSGKVSGYYHNQNVYLKNAYQGVYPKTDRIVVRGRVLDCDGLPLQGIVVTMTHGPSAISIADGTYAMIVHVGHACGGGFPSPRTESLIINAQGDCQFSACECGCPTTMTYIESQVPCNPNDITSDRVFNVQEMRLAPARSASGSGGDKVRGLKGGGSYGVGIVGYDAEGRAGFVNNIDYVSMPSFLSNGGEFEPSVITWTRMAALNLPEWVKYASFYITKNLSADFYIQWLGDKFELLDRSGKVTEEVTQAVRAQITIQSLLDFNTFHNQKTTTAYQFVKGDILRLYDDGEGNLFDTTTYNGYLDFLIQDNKDGNKVILDLDDRLKKLIGKCGFWFEVYRPKQCIGNQNYFEVCGVMPVRNGELMDATGTNILTAGVLNVWDTYYQKRVFIISACPGKTIGHPFEHASISDFWGDGCVSMGRTNIQNANAVQRWFPDDVIKSDAIVAEGQVNGLATFRGGNRKQFKGQEWGGIIAMRAERNLIFYVCQNDWFMTSYDLNYARVTEQGLIQVNTNSPLGDPYQKVGQNFGCQYEDAATIVADQGGISWVDVKNAAIILSNFQEAVDISLIDNKSYFVDKIKYANDFNSNLAVEDRIANMMEIVAGKDPLHNELYFTFRYRAGYSDESCRFINDIRQPRLDYQETIAYNMDLKKWTFFAGFTPEFYGMLRNSVNGVEMITMASGKPYEHNNKKVDGSFNVFYGQPTQQVIEIVENFDPIKTKIFQSISIDSKDTPYFIDRVVTDDPNALSYIPLSYMKKKEGTWYAEMLRNMNTYPDPNHPVVSQLIDGKRLFGKFAKIRLVKDLKEIDGYNELNNIIIRFTGSERSES